MVLIQWLMGLALLTQSCMSSLDQAEVGCKTWRQEGDNVCCDECHPGNRLVRQCGPRPKQLCTPCETGTYTHNPMTRRCDRCTQCVGAQVHLEDCTNQSDTQCGCKDGLTCGDGKCSFCVEKCAKGSEPTDDRSCRPCPRGTFNNMNHSTCKPWSTKCPGPNQEIVAEGNAFSDIQCQVMVPSEGVTSVDRHKPPVRPDPPGQVASYEVIMAVMMAAFIATAVVIIIIIVAVKVNHSKKKPEKMAEKQLKTPVIRTPTDDPRTLIAIECSFHEAQQEQGSSTESLIKDSSEEFAP
ncbi:tumor necrosis factor receptor superfamily member 9a [Nothobranchius furzeri]|uniref:Tumor necrosis factor receptor superfamily member 9-like n=4 Tax=Nothobranchius furzeri TaxID=105023 RepID=A0A8C6PU47_NOTFU|nr:tumor necrosis factor receptor superfamily member 9a [Nothobranchius furzeri]KAF7209249.1 tumor necrosis factor receptor superfamily member 9-like [Nothobranchius furzeri]